MIERKGVLRSVLELLYIYFYFDAINLIATVMLRREGETMRE